MRITPLIEYKLRSKDNPQLTMQVKENEWRDKLLKAWEIESCRNLIETDSQAAKCAEEFEVRIGIPGDFISAQLTIPKGTPKKEANRIIQTYRQEQRFFGKLGYATDWQDF